MQPSARLLLLALAVAFIGALGFALLTGCSGEGEPTEVGPCSDCPCRAYLNDAGKWIREESCDDEDVRRIVGADRRVDVQDWTIVGEGVVEGAPYVPSPLGQVSIRTEDILFDFGPGYLATEGPPEPDPNEEPDYCGEGPWIIPVEYDQFRAEGCLPGKVSGARSEGYIGTMTRFGCTYVRHTRHEVQRWTDWPECGGARIGDGD